MKRWISWLVVLLLVMQLVPFAALPAYAKEQTVTDTWVNPLYADFIDESELQPTERTSASRAPVRAATISAAAEELRAGLLARNTDITVSLPSPSGSFSDDEAKSLSRQIFYAAVDHTGNGNEGDYLHFQMGGYSSEIEYLSKTYTFNFHLKHFTTAAEEKQVDDKLSSVLSSLNLNGKTEAQKIRAIYDYICTHVTYDNARINEDISHTAYAALLEGKAVCQGYAALLYRMMLDSGIDCRMITGTGYNDINNRWEAHAWDIVRIGNLYYNVDATWDASYYAVFKSYDYYLRCNANFKDHTRNAETANLQIDYTSTAFNTSYPMSPTDYQEGTTPVIPPEPDKDGFVDVNDNDWFQTAVLWAVSQEPAITNGTDDTHFAPGKTCTRAEVVQFLYNAAGRPAVIKTVNPFVDVRSSDWFSQAVMWAVSNGITNGTDATHFAPAKKCSRSEVVAFLRNANGKPIPTSSSNPFQDVKSTDWFYASVLWAIEANITSGTTPTTFAPYKNCSRAEVVQFLYKAKDYEYIPPAMRVALITDYGDITDESFNQATYEGAKAWCEENAVDFTYYKPTGDSTAERVAAINQAVADGCNVLLLPGYAFADAIVKTVDLYPDVYYVALDVSEFDLQDAAGTIETWSYNYPANLYAAVYREELAGYLAGAAAVKLGYTKLGYLGGMAVPAVVRYGYGFVQGINDAAKELGNVDDIEVKYVYGNQFFGDPDITAYMDTWYAAGTEVVFACGGGIYTSACEAAAKTGGKIIGVDVDQASTINAYSEGACITSAMKGLGATVRAQLNKIKNNTFVGGQVECLGLNTENPSDSFVMLSDSTQWNGSFTKADYEQLLSKLAKGELTVSDNTDAAPAVDITVDYQGNIK